MNSMHVKDYYAIAIAENSLSTQDICDIKALFP